MTDICDNCPCCGRELQVGEILYCNDCSGEVNVDVHDK